METAKKTKEKLETHFEETKGIKVRYAYCHKGILVQGAIHSETTLSNTRVPGIQMTYTPIGLFVRAKNMTTIVPLANVVNVVIDES